MDIFYSHQYYKPSQSQGEHMQTDIMRMQAQMQ